jgi:uncharacterized protein YndB with AHSA1/START domain
MPLETSVVEHEVHVAARPETVFGFFTDPAKWVQWMGAEATLDPRPGGVCRIRINDAAVMSGEFVAVEPFQRILLSCGWEHELFAVPPQSTEVEVLFAPDGAGTVVRLAHRRLPSGSAAAHDAGWQHYLPRLAQAAAGEDPGSDVLSDPELARRILLPARRSVS